MTETVIKQKPIHSFAMQNQWTCGANQWTGFYMITASVMKGLICGIDAIRSVEWIMTSQFIMSYFATCKSWTQNCNINVLTILSYPWRNRDHELLERYWFIIFWHFVFDHSDYCYTVNLLLSFIFAKWILDGQYCLYIWFIE